MKQVDYSQLEECRLFLNAHQIVISEAEMLDFVTENRVLINTENDVIVGIQIINGEQVKVIGKGK